MATYLLITSRSATAIVFWSQYSFEEASWHMCVVKTFGPYLFVSIDIDLGTLHIAASMRQQSCGYASEVATMLFWKAEGP